jgi:hypothetical protein
VCALTNADSDIHCNADSDWDTNIDAHSHVNALALVFHGARVGRLHCVARYRLLSVVVFTVAVRAAGLW